jgi:hypothetical protein
VRTKISTWSARGSWIFAFVCVGIASGLQPAAAQSEATVSSQGTLPAAGIELPESGIELPTAGTQQAQCDFSDVPGAVWWGTDTRMTLREAASYMAPVYWFSPDEPLLRRTEGADIRIPEALPFEEAPDRPVIYYQLDKILKQPGSIGFYSDSADISESVIDFSEVGTFKMGFFAYFPSEVGLGAHPHDLEAAEFRGGFARWGGEYLADKTETECDEEYYVMVITQVTGKAHGIVWFWNVIEVDEETRFPMHLLIEEGKHAIGTDKNSDGYFSPGYDVSRYINDAWGTRDVIRSGALMSGGYQSWMTKVRQPEHRIFPPLPDDSPLRPRLEFRGAYDDPYVEYELRPLPASELALTSPGVEHAASLHRFMKSKEVEDWPEQGQAEGMQDYMTWLDEGAIQKTLSIALRADGDLGLSFVFPLFIVKNFEEPMTGGFIVNRMYLKDTALRDTYLAAGVEWDRFDVWVNEDDPDAELPPNPGDIEGWERTTSLDTDFVFETGIKFRVNVEAMKWLSWATDFWGFRAGIKNKGFWDISKLTYVFEIGAGAW